MIGSSVLVLGGYGGFGARLARRLAGDGWQVLVAGRDGAKAAQFAAGLPGAKGIAADRSGDLGPLLARHRPLLLIDAAGPFQGSTYRVPEACIAAGVHYLDLADGRDFVCGIGALDQSAKAAGVAVISGASSVPALSGAVVRELAAGMERVDAIDSCISATTRASSGRAVVQAALSYAGQPVPLWRAGRWEQAAGWTMLRRERFALPGARPLRRLVGLADVPDLALFPALVPGAPAVTFRGGSELSLQMLGLSLLARVVGRGWLRSAVPLARWLAPLQQASARLGGDRSAMAVELRGWAAGRPLKRRWMLIAEQGQGQEIPAIAAQLLARRLAEGALAPGARTGAGELALSEFTLLLGALPVRWGSEEEVLLPPYRRVLGDRFAALAPELQALHQPLAVMTASGEAEVTRGSGLLARLLGWAMRFPPAGPHLLEVRFVPRRGRERWFRHFGQHGFSSELGAGPGGLLTERFGPLRFHFALPVDQAGSLSMVLRRWTVCGLPLPLPLAPRIAAREWAEAGRFHFDVAVAMPLLGPVVHYRGWLLV